MSLIARISGIAKSSIFRRLLVIFIIITIPIFLIGINFYNKSVNTLRRELIGSMNSKIDYYLHNIESEFQRISDIQNNLINDSDLNKLSNMNSYTNSFSNTITITSLQEKLRTIKNSSNYIEDVSIYLPSIGKELSAPGGKRYIVNEYPEDFIEKAQNAVVNFRERSIFFDNNISLLLVYPPKQNPGRHPLLFISEIVLSKSRIVKDLKGLNEEHDGGVFIYDNISHNFIVSGNAAYVPRQIAAELNTAQSGKKTVTVGGKKYLAVYGVSENLNITLINYVREDILLNPIREYQRWLWLILLSFFLMIFIYAYVVNKYINRPVSTLVEKFKLLEKGDLDVNIDYIAKDEFEVLYRQFNYMVNKLGILIDQVYKQTIYTQKAELKQLQSQINPHFLYNSYFLLHRLIKRGDPGALEFSKSLGEYFKFITRNATENVALKDEVYHARIYANMQAIRFRERIEVVFEELPEQIEEILVPKLILQPILENAFMHGLEDKQENGLLHVGFEPGETGFKILVRDNGIGLGPEEINQLSESIDSNEDFKEYTGLINIHRRLQLAFGMESGLRFTGQEGEGLTVEIVIKYNKQDNKE